jgi:hypothetical protein
MRFGVSTLLKMAMGPAEKSVLRDVARQWHDLVDEIEQLERLQVGVMFRFGARRSHDPVGQRPTSSWSSTRCISILLSVIA